jgi:hypothetical protein
MLNNSNSSGDHLSPQSKVSENSVLNTVLSFFQTLASKRLVPLDDLNLLFDCPLTLFASFKNCSRTSLKKQLLKKVSEVDDWGSEQQIFSFLNRHPKLVESFLKDPTNNIFKGLLLYFLCHFYKKKGKLYQFHDKKSLVSCELGLESDELLRLGIIILNGGFQFCPLRKIQK